MNKKFDLIVVGAGVLGTFHAYHAAKKGLRVLVVEKDKMPTGATVRNFGQVVPSGMDSKWQNYGKESLAIYKEIQNKFDISVRQNGSVYLASDPQEMALLEELHTINNKNGYQSMLLTKAQCLARYRGLKADYVQSGLYFPQEVTVEPRVMIHRLQGYLKEQQLVDFKFNCHVLDIQQEELGVCLSLANGQQIHAQKVIVCCGSEFKTLFPETFNKSDMQVTKLQMMQTKVQPGGYQLQGSILTGLSIRRYEAFNECPSYKAIKAQEPLDSLEKKYGVHILFKQATDGSVIIGDSHQYADAANSDDLGFDIKHQINAFMIEKAKEIFDLPSFEIADSWFGIYSQCKNSDIFNYNVSDNIHIVTGIGGKGMTGSAGYAKENINTLYT